MPIFTIQETPHHVGDRKCPECWEDYPAPCVCGGLIHATGGTEEDEDGNVLLVTRCDACGRSEDDLQPS